MHRVSVIPVCGAFPHQAPSPSTRRHHLSICLLCGDGDLRLVVAPSSPPPLLKPQMQHLEPDHTISLTPSAPRHGLPPSSSAQGYAAHPKTTTTVTNATTTACLCSVPPPRHPPLREQLLLLAARRQGHARALRLDRRASAKGQRQTGEPQRDRESATVSEERLRCTFCCPRAPPRPRACANLFAQVRLRRRALKRRGVVAASHR